MTKAKFFAAAAAAVVAMLASTNAYSIAHASSALTDPNSATIEVGKPDNLVYGNPCAGAWIC